MYGPLCYSLTKASGSMVYIMRCGLSKPERVQQGVNKLPWPVLCLLSTRSAIIHCLFLKWIHIYTKVKGQIMVLYALMYEKKGCPILPYCDNLKQLHILQMWSLNAKTHTHTSKRIHCLGGLCPILDLRKSNVSLTTELSQGSCWERVCIHWCLTVVSTNLCFLIRNLIVRPWICGGCPSK